MKRAAFVRTFIVLLAAPAFVAAVPSVIGQTTVTTTGGTKGFSPRFSGSATVVNSEIFDTGTTVGIGVGSTPNTSVKLDIGGGMIVRGNTIVSRTGNATASKGFGSYGFEFFSNAFNSSTNAAVNPYFTVQSEPTGNNTASPSATFNLLFSNNGAASAETGFSINPNGTINFSSAQTFPIAAGPQGPTGPQGPQGPPGGPGPQGANGAAGGQVWSASTVLPASLPNGSQLLAPPSGASLAGSNFAPSFLQTPLACTAANFSVTVLGAANASTATISLIGASAVDLASNSFFSTALACKVTANNGQPVSCTSGGSQTFSGPVFLTNLVDSFSHAPDYQKAVIYVSFTCQ